MTAALKAIALFFKGVPSWIYIAIALAAAAAWIDHRGYQRAEEHELAERRERIIQNGAFVFELERQLDAGFAELERRTAATRAQIQKEDSEIVQPIIRQELANDPALLTRQCLTPELVRAINIARGGNAGGATAAAADGGSAPSVPGSQAAR